MQYFICLFVLHSAELDAEHAQKVLDMEHTQQMKLKERQKFFEEAFQQDMEQYLSTGYLQIAERRGKFQNPFPVFHKLTTGRTFVEGSELAAVLMLTDETLWCPNSSLVELKLQASFLNKLLVLGELDSVENQSAGFLCSSSEEMQSTEYT